MVKSIFFRAKNPRLAHAISIVSPKEFRKSIVRVKGLKGIPKLKKQKALVLARTRAKVMLKRKNLSGKERKQMKAISKIPIRL